MLTLNGIKQEISYIYLHALATSLGYSVERTCIDMDSVDATICAKGRVADSKGTILSPKIDIQLKATQQECSGNSVAFPISMKNYNDLRQNTMVPKILIVVFLPLGTNWISLDPDKILVYGKGYWMSLKGMNASENGVSETIYFSESHQLTIDTVRQWMIAAANREDLAYVSC